MEDGHPRTQTYDPVAFDISRYQRGGLVFWVPHFMVLGDLAPRHRILDVGCATGGFTIAIRRALQSLIVGVDYAAYMLRYAAAKPEASEIPWMQGSAGRLPFRDTVFDRVLMSLVLHQIEHRDRAVSEACRVLRPQGILIIRTVDPLVITDRVPYCFFSRLAEMEAARLPPIPDVLNMCAGAGFQDIRTKTVCRNLQVNPEEEIAALKKRSRKSYQCLTDRQIEEGIAAIRQEWNTRQRQWIDPRPHVFITGRKISSGSRL